MFVVVLLLAVNAWNAAMLNSHRLSYVETVVQQDFFFTTHKHSAGGWWTSLGIGWKYRSYYFLSSSILKCKLSLSFFIIDVRKWVRIKYFPESKSRFCLFAIWKGKVMRHACDVQPADEIVNSYDRKRKASKHECWSQYCVYASHKISAVKMGIKKLKRYHIIIIVNIVCHGRNVWFVLVLHLLLFWLPPMYVSDLISYAI